MVLNTNIPMMGNTLDTATPINQYAQGVRADNLRQYQMQRQAQQDQRQATLDQQNAQTNALKDQYLQAQILNAHMQNLSDRQTNQMKEGLAAAIMVKPMLDRNDVAGALHFLENGNHNADSGAVNDAIDMLKSGDIQGVKDSVDGLISLGHAYGYLKTPTAQRPVNVSQGGTLVDPVTGKVIYQDQGIYGPEGGNIGAASGQQAGSSITGDQYLATLPQPIAAQVKALAEGRQNFPGGYALKSPYWQQMISAVSQYDPSFDAVNYGARSKTRNDFTSGKSAQNITAMNTAMGHLQSLSNAFENLDNSAYPSYNSLANRLGNEFGIQHIQTATSNVATDANAVANELAKVFRSTGMSEKDVDEWRKQISTNSTPAQSKAVIGSAIELLNSRLNALAQQYNQGMGTTKDGIDLLSPAAQNAYNNLTGGGTGHIPQSAMQYLRQNPGARQQFDEKYGPGSSDIVLGK